MSCKIIVLVAVSVLPANGSKSIPEAPSPKIRAKPPHLYLSWKSTSVAAEPNLKSELITIGLEEQESAS